MFDKVRQHMESYIFENDFAGKMALTPENSKSRKKFFAAKAKITVLWSAYAHVASAVDLGKVLDPDNKKEDAKYLRLFMSQVCTQLCEDMWCLEIPPIQAAFMARQKRELALSSNGVLQGETGSAEDL